MDYERAINRLRGMQDDVERRINALPPLLRGRASLWADLEALSVAVECIHKQMEREKAVKNGPAQRITMED